MKNILVILFLVSCVNLFPQTVIPIDSVRRNDANGSPVLLNQIVTISGIVTSSNQFGTSGPGSIQDFTAGMSIFSSVFASGVQIGDSVKVTGKVTQFNGLSEITDVTAPNLVIYSSGHPVEPRVVTLDQIINQQWNYFEEFESMLIRINNVTIAGSGNFASGTNYTITDSSGTITNGLRIDNDVSSIIGTAIPTQPVDIIGILAQFKSAAPYNTGYQLLPRFINDIVSDGRPLILSPVNAANIDTSSFTVYFNTARHGNSQVKFGLTDSLELGTVTINDDTTYHVVPITGLQPATQYFFKAFSTNSFGTSEGPLMIVTTASSDTSTGQINVYFNFAIDPSVAIPGNVATGNSDFKQKIIDRINLATFSIDMAVYSFFGMQEVADAIVLAKNRGVKVRVVYDNRVTQNSMQVLINAGIKISKKADGNGIMHNKFFVFDARDQITNNDWVWTGSWNVTSSELTWKNNVIEINDQGLALAYQKEFEEMWGSTNEDPNPSTAKFGNQKSDNTPHNFSIKGRSVQSYFSPSDGTSAKIINAINTANHSIYLAMYAFTYNSTATAIQQRYQAGANDVKGIMDDVSGQGNEFAFLQGIGADMWANTGQTLHHKYSIIDASFPESDPYLITGSHNWSAAAETSNDENTLILKDIYLVNQYMQEFKKRYNELGGTGTFIIPVINDVNDNNPITDFAYKLFQNYPNPFNPVTTIRFELPVSMHVELKLYDVLGREVRTLFNSVAPSGVVAVDLNANGLPSGVYIYKINAEGFTASKKLILMK